MPRKRNLIWWRHIDIILTTYNASYLRKGIVDNLLIEEVNFVAAISASPNIGGQYTHWLGGECGV